jgi:8-oxo-dGTP diphosphatase
MKKVFLKDRPKGMRASAIIVRDDKMLFLRQVVNGYEFYTIPGGSWEDDDILLEDTCKREILEEVGLNVEVKSLAFIVDTFSRMNFVFNVAADEGDPELGGPEKDRMNENDQYHIEWVDVNTLDKLEIVPPAAKNGLVKYFQNIGQDNFLITDFPSTKHVAIILPQDTAEYQKLFDTVSDFYKSKNYIVDIIDTLDNRPSDEQLHQYRNIISFDDKLETLEFLNNLNHISAYAYGNSDNKNEYRNIHIRDINDLMSNSKKVFANLEKELVW